MSKWYDAHGIKYKAGGGPLAYQYIKIIGDQRPGKKWIRVTNFNCWDEKIRRPGWWKLITLDEQGPNRRVESIWIDGDLITHVVEPVFEGYVWTYLPGLVEKGCCPGIIRNEILEVAGMTD